MSGHSPGVRFYEAPVHSEAAREKRIVENMSKCAIPSCKIRVNSERRIRDRWFPLCSYDHRIEMYQRVLDNEKKGIRL